MIPARQWLYTGGTLAALAIGGGLYAAGVFDYLGIRADSDRPMAAPKTPPPDAAASTPRAASDVPGDPPRAELTAPAAVAGASVVIPDN